MTRPVLTRASEALTDAETTALLRDRLGDGVLDVVTEFGDHTVVVAAEAWRDAVTACRDESLLAFDMFDCLFGVDAGEDGFDVVAVLYSTSKGRRIMLRTTCEGGRDEPRLDSVADLYPGANWMERETFDMFGIDFDGHPALLPRILTVENFEGWPLRRDFALASRVAKPWPGVNEPVETDEDGNVVRTERAIGEAPGPSGLDEVIARQAREANADAGASEADAGASAGGGSGGGGGDESAREEVEMDQEVYDDLIAQGKSERIARSKAKAAFIKAQRKAERAAADAGDARASQADAGAADPGGGDAGASDADADGSAGRNADEGGDESADGDAEPAVDAEAAAAARARADDARARQAEARDAKAAEQAEQGPADDADEDLEGVPEGTPVDADPDGGDADASHGDSGAGGGSASQDADDRAGRTEESQ